MSNHFYVIHALEITERLSFFIVVSERGRFDFVADFNQYCSSARAEKIEQGGY